MRASPRANTKPVQGFDPRDTNVAGCSHRVSPPGRGRPPRMIQIPSLHDMRNQLP